MVGKKLTTRRHFLKSLALGSAFISYWPCHMRMAIASEHTNQHKFNTTYLFDENRWWGGDPYNLYAGETLAQFAQMCEDVGITDMILQVYGHGSSGGPMGWTSSLLASSTAMADDLLADVVTEFHGHGILVHGVFNTCKHFPTRGNFAAAPNSASGTFVDVHNPVFQAFISDLVAECAEKYPVDGVCLDFIRTDDYTSPRDGAGRIPKNDESIENIVRMVYEKTKAVKPECIVSSTTVPWQDITHPDFMLEGRKAINWANAGIHDIIFGFEYGNPPDLEVQNIEGVRDLITNGTPVIGMYASYARNADGTSRTQTPAEFQATLDTVAAEETIAIYTGWALTDEHIALLEEARGLPPEPTKPTEPSPTKPEPVPPTSSLFFQRKNFF